jgi:hypothetical protein
MNAQQLGQKIKDYPMLVVCGLLIPLFIGLIFLRYPEIERLEAEQLRLDNELQTSVGNLRNANGLVGQLNHLKVLDAELAERLMDRSQKGLNLNYFYRFEDRNNIRILQADQVIPPQEATKVVVKKPAKGDKAKKEAKPVFDHITFKISVEGSYRDLLRFLYYVQHERYFVSCSRFVCVRSKEATTEKLKADIELVILGNLL